MHNLRREVLGEKHPIRSMADLATTYHNQGRYGEAEVFHKTALDLRRYIFGEDHPHTTQSIMCLASTQESLQQMRSLVRPVQSLAVTQVRNSEERNPRHSSLREVMHVLFRSFREGRSH